MHCFDIIVTNINHVQLGKLRLFSNWMKYIYKMYRVAWLFQYREKPTCASIHLMCNWTWNQCEVKLYLTYYMRRSVMCRCICIFIKTTFMSCLSITFFSSEICKHKKTSFELHFAFLCCIIHYMNLCLAIPITVFIRLFHFCNKFVN